MKKLARLKSLHLYAMLILALCPSCAIKVYLVDRQTVLEDEAAGDWPEFEKEILQKTQSSSPTPFPVVAENGHKARLFNVLNGELTSTRDSSQAASPLVKPAQPAASVARK